MINRANYQMIQKFKEYHLGIKQTRLTSVVKYEGDLAYLLRWADETPFNQVVTLSLTFPDYLVKHTTLQPETKTKIIKTTKSFLTWGKLHHPREFNKVPAIWISDLHVPHSGEQRLRREYVTLEETLQLVDPVAGETDLPLWRDQAAPAMLFISAARAAAFATLPIQAVNLQQSSIQQWTSLGVKTKRGKSATTYLLNIPELLDVVTGWDDYIRQRLPDSAMWFTPILSQWGDHQLLAQPAGKCRNQALAKRIALLYKKMGLAAKSPHKFRHGHAVFGLQGAETMPDYKAISMNLMHDDIRVTDSIYALLTANEVQERIHKIGHKNKLNGIHDPELRQMLEHLSRSQKGDAIQYLAKELAK